MPRSASTTWADNSGWVNLCVGRLTKRPTFSVDTAPHTALCSPLLRTLAAVIRRCTIEDDRATAALSAWQSPRNAWRRAQKTRLGMAGTPRSGPLAEFVRPVSLQRAVLKLLPWCLCCSVAD